MSGARAAAPAVSRRHAGAPASLGSSAATGPLAATGPSAAARLGAALAVHPLVADARVVDLGATTAAMVVPSAAGVARLRGRGWLGLAEALAGVDAEAVAWRFVEALPEAGEPSAVAALLAAPLPREPRVLALAVPAPAILELRAQVPLDLAVCREHFPRAPIVPGVVQLSWLDAWARAHLGLRGRFVALEAVKFGHVVQPGELLDVRLEWRADERRLWLRATSAPRGAAGGADVAPRRHASGRLVYEAE